MGFLSRGPIGTACVVTIVSEKQYGGAREEEENKENILQKPIKRDQNGVICISYVSRRKTFRILHGHGGIFT